MFGYLDVGEDDRVYVSVPKMGLGGTTKMSKNPKHSTLQLGGILDRLKRVEWYLKRPRRILSRLRIIKPNLEYQIDWKSLGKHNPHKKFLILRIAALPEFGMLSAWSSIASDYRWCKVNGIIPVIDYEPYTNFDHGQLFGASEWSEVFIEPCSNPIKEILESKHVGLIPIGFLTKGRYRIDSGKDREYYKTEFEFIKSNCWFQPLYLAKLKETYNSTISQNARVLAVSVREEFELLKNAGWSRSVFHPDEPPIKEVLHKAAELIEQWNCEYCFISTRYKDTIKLFLDFFGDKLLFIERKRITIDQEYISYLKGFSTKETPQERLSYCRQNVKFAHLEKEIRDEYLSEIFILSKCTHLVATKSSASIAAMYWNAGEYERTYFFEDNNQSKY